MAAFNFIIEPILTLLFLYGSTSTALNPVVIFYSIAGIANLFIYFQRTLPALRVGSSLSKIRKAKEEAKQNEAPTNPPIKKNDVVANDKSVNDSLLIV
jgi:hypothetical protein